MNRNHFTLVELLVVVGLISLLLGLMAPAFSRMMSGNKVSDAAGNLKLGLEQAQSYAVSRRAYVALILPNKSAADTDNSDERAALLGGFRLAEVSVDRSSSTIKFKQWIEDCPWKSRSEGALLVCCKMTEPKTTDERGEVLTEDIPIEGAWDSIEYSNLQDCEYPLDPEHPETLTTRNKCAVVFSPYGGCYGTGGGFFVVAEGQINGDNLVLAGEKEEKTNFVTLKVNGYTGRVEYYGYENGQTKSNE